MFNRLSIKHIRNFALVAIYCAFVIGCSNDSGLTSVSGIVTVDGKPVTEGTIMFYPTGGRPAASQIAPDGSYELTSFKRGDGVPAGNHKVTISAYTTIRPKNAVAPTNINEETEANMAEGKIVWLVDKKYSKLQTSKITAEVKAGEPNEINFDSADFE